MTPPGRGPGAGRGVEPLGPILVRVLDDLLTHAVDLDDDTRRVLDEHRWDLYTSDEVRE